MKRAIPNVLRFTLCCVLLYAGFCFCDWVVLWPYHIKFRSLSSTSECLFAMMIGDDLFTTFTITNTNNNLICWFSRKFVYFHQHVYICRHISAHICHNGLLRDSQRLLPIWDYPDQNSSDDCLTF
ncbi:mucolipin-3 [Trichonephila clavipes]|uniref:Mucolipin-3 n=1 Tax=Trichonephila clavipes TaxID=2585209 RepID=A0A8X6VXV2_TRICX|nr:mucolipin-3 [Trichonephila clavipes]